MSLQRLNDTRDWLVESGWTAKISGSSTKAERVKHFNDAKSLIKKAEASYKNDPRMSFREHLDMHHAKFVEMEAKAREKAASSAGQS